MVQQKMNTVWFMIMIALQIALSETASRTFLMLMST